MGATAVIVFREALEIALVLGILLAATKGLPGRARWFWLGMGGGTAGALLIAWSADAISNALDGVGQEVFNAGIMFTAVLMLGWTVLWMTRHGKQISLHLRHVGHSVAHGDAPMVSLSLVIALAVFREGAEIALFTYGIAAAGQATLAEIVAGGLIGAAGGLAVGTLMYCGLLHMARRHLFAVTSWMLVFLTAGMAAAGASFLIAAGYLPELTSQVWDSSNLLPENSALGAVLHVLVGYSDRPTGMESLFYLATLAILGGSLLVARREPKPQQAS